MEGRTIEVSGIPYIPSKQLLLDFLEGLLGSGRVWACRLMKNRSHESSSSNCCEREGDRQVRAVVETEDAESALTLYKLAKAGILIFWCSALAVKFVSFPDPDHVSPPDLNSRDVPSDPEMCVSEEESSIEDLLLEQEVGVSKVSETRELSETRVSEPEFVQEPPEAGPKMYIPDIFGLKFVSRPKIPVTKAVYELDVLSGRNFF